MNTTVADTVGIVTVGGASPATNTTIFHLVRRLKRRQLRPVGIPFKLLFEPDGHFEELDLNRVEIFRDYPGSMLETARLDPREFADPAEMYRLAWQNLNRHRISALIVIGGGGTLSLVNQVREIWNLPIVVIPKTIDNDIVGIDQSLGFDSIVQHCATELLQTLYDPLSYADHNFIVYETMGRDCGWIAVRAVQSFFDLVMNLKREQAASHDLMYPLYIPRPGLTMEHFFDRYLRVDALLIPEVHFRWNKVLEWVYRTLQREDKKLVCVVIAEGVRKYLKDLSSDVFVRLNEGAGALLTDRYKQEYPGSRARCLIPSITARAAPISKEDEQLSWLLAMEAVELALTKDLGTGKVLVGTRGGKVRVIPVEEVAGKSRRVPLTLFHKVAAQTDQPLDLFSWDKTHSG